MKLRYKFNNGNSVTFDSYQSDNSANEMDSSYGLYYWADICSECIEKLDIGECVELDECGSPTACCGVLGCNNSGEYGADMYYIDLTETEVELI